MPLEMTDWGLLEVCGFFEEDEGFFEEDEGSDEGEEDSVMSVSSSVMVVVVFLVIRVQPDSRMDSAKAMPSNLIILFKKTTSL